MSDGAQAHILDECVAGLGTDLVAYVLGAGASGPLFDWRLDGTLNEQAARRRLALSRRILRLFDNPVQARAWLRRFAPELGRRSPAHLIRVAAGDADLERVYAAAQREAANGAL